MAYTLQDNFQPGSSSAFQSLQGTNKAQTFAATDDYTITKITLTLKKDVSAASRTFYVRLYTVSGGLPGTELAEFGSFDQTSLTLTYDTYEFTDTTYAVTNGTDYAIVVETEDLVTNSFLYWFTSNSGYAGGQAGWTNYTGPWQAQSGYDKWFAVYSSDAVEYAEGTKTVTAAGTASLPAGPGKATTPGPTDDQTNIFIAGSSAINAFTWEAPVGETPDYLVYFRASGGTWALQETITDDSTTHYLSASVRDSLSYYSIYEWRVDTRDPDTLLITTGDTWTFITQVSPSFTDFTRRSDYDADQVWQPGTGWVDINSFEFTGGGRYKGRIVVVGHQVIYFGDL